jgi:hypothetical protein
VSKSEVVELRVSHTVDDTRDVSEDGQKDVDALRTTLAQYMMTVNERGHTKSAPRPRSRKTPTGGRRTAKLDDKVSNLVACH